MINDCPCVGDLILLTSDAGESPILGLVVDYDEQAGLYRLHRTDGSAWVIHSTDFKSRLLLWKLVSERAVR